LSQQEKNFRPRTVEAYVKMIEDALAEVDELRYSYEFDMEGMGSTPNFVEPIDGELKELLAAMRDGSYAWGSEDLAYMKYVNRFKDKIPFHRLLAVINETHQQGLNVDDEA